MPSFPTGVFSPTSKSAGQVIQPAHINDLQDEVVAIESGYLNGTAPLNSSNSTVANLQVTGGCTAVSLVAASLSVTGGSTFAVRPVMPADVTYLTGSTTNLANASSVALTWPTQIILTNSSVHSTATNADRFVPQSTGIYAMSASIILAADFTPGSTASLQLHIKDSSGTRIASQRIGSVGSISVGVGCSALKRFDVVGSTNWLRVVAEQRSGSTHSILGPFSWAQFYRIA